MSTKDVIKKSILEGFSMEMSTFHVVSILLITVLLSVYIFYIYRLNSHSSFYSRDFNKTLAIMPVLTAAIVLALQASLVISLGMVGALSIVRFRNAIKNPMDLLFLFWSISTGIICGANLYLLGVVACLVVTVALFVLDLIPVTKAPMLLIVNSSDTDGEDAVLDIVKRFSKYCRVKSRTVSAGRLDLVIEVRVSEEGKLVKEMSALEKMDSVSLISHDGETTY